MIRRQPRELDRCAHKVRVRESLAACAYPRAEEGEARVAELRALHERRRVRRRLRGHIDRALLDASCVRGMSVVVRAPVRAVAMDASSKCRRQEGGEDHEGGKGAHDGRVKITEKRK
jgi:hypothetical protein